MQQGLSQSQKLEQGLSLTSQLKRSLEILQAPSLELEEMVSRELSSNPLLEEVSGSGDGVVFSLEPCKTRKRTSEEGDFDDSFDSTVSGGGEIIPRGGDEFEYADSVESDSVEANMRRDYIFNSAEQPESSTEYILKQAVLDSPDRITAKACAFLVSLMDERGFIPSDALERTKAEGYSDEEASAALKLLRGMSPAGIGAFDMRDSLMLQLEHKGRADSVAYRILRDHYDLLMKRKVSEIASSMRISAAEVESAINSLSELKTSPLRDFDNSPSDYVCVDLIAKRGDDGLWRAELTNERVPELRINTEYRNMLALGKLGKEAKAYVGEKTREGKFLIEAIAHRQRTLKSIGDQICMRQSAFFSGGGFGALKPLTMQTVAEALDMHPTTVSRAVSEKYMQTPFGVVPLKRFFVSSVASADGEQEVSNAAVKSLLSEIISVVSASDPLSDSEIAKILKDSYNMSVARRTVAKYRDALGIPPKSLRKRY